MQLPIHPRKGVRKGASIRPPEPSNPLGGNMPHSHHENAAEERTRLLSPHIHPNRPTRPPYESARTPQDRNINPKPETDIHISNINPRHITTDLESPDTICTPSTREDREKTQGLFSPYARARP